MPPAAPSTAAPQQHKQASRKGRKAWRKNVDLTEVQDGLENVRDEVIRTGGVIAEKPSASLFALDTAGSEEIRKKVPKALRQLKADQIIAQRSAVPAVDSRKRHSASGTTDGLVEPTSKRHKGAGVTHKELERLKHRAYNGGAGLKDVIKTGESSAGNDLWEEQPARENVHVQTNFLPKPKRRTMPKTLREAPVSLLENGKAMPSVVKPNPGISYNPQFEDYEKLLQEEGDKAVSAEVQRLKAVQEEEEKQARIDAAQEEAERSEYYTEDESVWEGIETDAEGKGSDWVKKKRPERKTQAERNKIKRRKEQEREERHQARMAERGQRGIRAQADADAQGALAKVEGNTELDRVDGSDIQDAADSSDDEIDDRKLRRRRFGAIPVPEKPLELVLADELQDSLRLLKPEGNLLKERFRNYLVGGKVETRRPGFQAKKAKRKATEKWTHKDFMVPT